MEKTDENIFDEVDTMNVEEMLNGDFTKHENKTETSAVKIDKNDIAEKEIKNKKIKSKKHKKPYKHGKPLHIERYPHTHYFIPNDPTFDAKKYLYILNEWLMSLTKLAGLIATDSKEGDLKLTQEIYDLIQKLKECRDLLNTYLQLYFNNEQNVLDDLYALLAYYGNTLIPQLNTKLKAIFDCIENRLMVHDKYINDIFEYINDIYEILQSLVANDYDTKTLALNTDYTIIFYNGWYNASEEVDAPRVRRFRTAMNTPYGNYITDEIHFDESVAYQINNSNVLNSSNINGDYAPYFHHGSSYEDVPTSWKWRITFADTNIKNPTSVSQIDNDIANVRPLSARASWPVKCSLNIPQSGQVLCAMASIGDGWNQQYGNYITAGETTELNFIANTNCHMVATYNYKV